MEANQLNTNGVLKRRRLLWNKVCSPTNQKSLRVDSWRLFFHHSATRIMLIIAKI